jgi:hypothetical protein
MAPPRCESGGLRTHTHHRGALLDAEYDGRGALVLGFRSSEDARATADLPASVYRLYSKDEVIALVETAGFTDTRAVMPGERARQILFVGAQRPR